jgi:hypothetical protein
MKELQISKIDALELQSFVKKLLSIDKFIFLKVSSDKTVSSVFLPQRDAVKLASTNTSDLFEIEGSVEKPIKVSFFNGTRVIEALSHFSGDIKGTIVYQDYGDEYVATDFVVYDDNLKINLFCSDPSLSFMEMSKDEITRAFGTANALFSFELLTTHADKMKSLFNLDRENELFKLYADEKGVHIKGENYDQVLGSRYENKSDENELQVSVYKKYLPLLDKENYEMTICSNKIVFKSLDTDTLLTIAVAITDD